MTLTQSYEDFRLKSTATNNSNATTADSSPTSSSKGVSLDTLPDDVLGQIFGQLEIDELVRLRNAGRGLSDRVSSLGIPLYHSNHRQAYTTLYPPSSEWDPHHLVRRNHKINRSIARHSFHALQVGGTWSQAVIPTLNLTGDHVYVGVGGKFLAYPLIPPPPPRATHRHEQNWIGNGYAYDDRSAPPDHTAFAGFRNKGESRRCGGSKVVDRAREYPIGKRDSGGRADVVGVIPSPPPLPTSSRASEEGQPHARGPPQPQSLIVGQFDGTIQRVTLSDEGASIPRVTAKYQPISNSPGPGPDHASGSGSRSGYKENIHTLTANEDGSKFMSTSVSGQVNIYTTRSPWTPPVSMQLSVASGNPRAWSTCLITANPALQPTAFLGVQGSINLHALTSTGLRSDTTRKLIGPEEPLFSSPYDITLPPSSTYANSSSASTPSSSHSPSGSGLDVLSTNHHPSTLLSAWYDSHLRLHDLRSSSRLPASSYMDPYTWADGSAFYSTCFLGGHYIAGGGARHGTVSIFDIRKNDRPITKTRVEDRLIDADQNGNADGDAFRMARQQHGASTRPRPGWSCFSPGGKGSPVYKLQGEGGRIWGVTERRLFLLSFDDAGFVPNGILSSDLSGTAGGRGRDKDKDRGREAPSGWKGRGGKWGWTVRYDQDQYTRATGYEHVERGIELFDSLELA
ncbi:hypothetical protein IAU59_005666 [Kwoniella sp. CBS 9459]